MLHDVLCAALLMRATLLRKNPSRDIETRQMPCWSILTLSSVGLRGPQATVCRFQQAIPRATPFADLRAKGMPFADLLDFGAFSLPAHINIALYYGWMETD